MENEEIGFKYCSSSSISFERPCAWCTTSYVHYSPRALWMMVHHGNGLGPLLPYAMRCLANKTRINDGFSWGMIHQVG